MSFRNTFALIDAYVAANGAALPATLTATLQNGDQGPVWRLCRAIGVLVAAHGSQAGALRAATLTLAQQLITYAEVYGFFGLDYASLLAQLAADDAALAAAPPAAS